MGAGIFLTSFWESTIRALHEGSAKDLGVLERDDSTPFNMTRRKVPPRNGSDPMSPLGKPKAS